MKYTKQDVKKVVDLHLKVIDGVIPLSALEYRMKEKFGENNAQFRNARQYSNRHRAMMETATPANGFGMPANWANAFLEALYGRQEFSNFLEALRKQYAYERSIGKAGYTLKSVIEKWEAK